MRLHSVLPPSLTYVFVYLTFNCAQLQAFCLRLTSPRAVLTGRMVRSVVVLEGLQDEREMDGTNAYKSRGREAGREKKCQQGAPSCSLHRSLQ